MAPALIAASALLLALLGAPFLVGAMRYAHRSIGIGEGAPFAVVFPSLLGGAINIPPARWRAEPDVVVAEIVVFGVRSRPPLVQRSPSTIRAVNLGTGFDADLAHGATRSRPTELRNSVPGGPPPPLRSEIRRGYFQVSGSDGLSRRL